MGIKGPYLTTTHVQVTTTRNNTQSQLHDLYQSRPTHQYLPNGTDSTGYYIAWFSDQGVATHAKWTLTAEITYYRRGVANAPEPVTITQEVEYLTGDVGNPSDGNDYTPSPFGDHPIYKELGQTAWFLDLKRLEVDGVAIPSLAVDGAQTYATWTYGSVTSSENSDGSIKATYTNNAADFDFVRMAITISPEGELAEYAKKGTLEIEANPEWHAISAQYLDINTLAFCVVSDIGRTDDRWAIEPNSYVIADGGNILRSDAPWGTFNGVRTATTAETTYMEDAFGRTYAYVHVAYVDTTYFCRLMAGKRIHAEMHFNHVWNAASVNMVYAKDDIDVITTSYIRPPKLEAEANNGTVTIKVSPDVASDTNTSGDGGTTNRADCTAYIVAMLDAKFKNDIQLLDATSGELTFPYPPLDKYITFEGVGFYTKPESGAPSEMNDDEVGTIYASEVGTYAMVVSSGGCRFINSVSTDKVCKLRFNKSGDNMGRSVSTSSDSVTEQLAGRSRPSVFYGGAGSTSVSFSGELVDDQGEDFEDLPDSGLCVVRFPGGQRYAADLQVSIDDSGNHLTSVSVSGTEVDF